MCATFDSPAYLASGYNQIEDPEDVCVVVRELSRVAQWLDQLADIAGEMVDVPTERAAGIRAAKALVTQLRQRADHRLTDLLRRGIHEVVVVDPDESALMESPLGLSVLPMISVPAVGTRGISSAVVTIPPGRASVPEADAYDAIIVVLFGAIQILWWDRHKAKRVIAQRRNQHAHIGRGISHALFNPGGTPALILYVRATADAMAGFGLIPDDLTTAAAGGAPCRRTTRPDHREKSMT